MRDGTTSGVAIFVKTPGRSPVKSRLAAACGRTWAEEWYRRAAACVAGAAAQAGVAAYWAVAEPDAASAWPGLPVVPQGDGGLGERMARVHATLIARHGSGLLLGADAPQVSPALLCDAVAWVTAAAARLALGPARDGGFWLFGGNVAPPEAVWTSVRYSKPETARDFRAALAPYGAWRDLPTLTDADHAEDLPQVLAELRALADPLPAQRALAEWMGRA